MEMSLIRQVLSPLNHRANKKVPICDTIVDGTDSESDTGKCSKKLSQIRKRRDVKTNPPTCKPYKRARLGDLFDDTFICHQSTQELVRSDVLENYPLPSTSGNESGFKEFKSQVGKPDGSSGSKKENTDLNFTEIISSSPFLKNVENAINKMQQIKKTPLKNISNNNPRQSQSKRKRDFWDDTFNDVLNDLFKSSEYKRELEESFEFIEKSIIGRDNEREMSLLNESNSTKTSQNNKSLLLEKSLNSPKILKTILDHAEKTINFAQQNSSSTLRKNESFSMPQSGVMGSTIKSAFMDNINNSLSLDTSFVNATLIEENPDFVSCGPFYGLPEKVMDLIRAYKGIDKLYDWQHECLNLPAITFRKNLVYALPTSGGKTLVAEILMFREILCRKKNAIFILPYVAIVQEKVWALSPFAVALEFLVEEYAAGKGNYPPRKRRRKRSAYICTIEKALGLVNSLIESERIDEIGLVVVDELHLLGDDSRGTNLESLLTKLMILQEKIQIVGMSATIGNLDEICKFLNADVYRRDFRPVELVEYVKCQNEIARVNNAACDEENLLIFEKKVNYYKNMENLVKLDPDHLGGLVMDVIPDSSCLIFCKTKQNCENVAMLLCKVLKPQLKKHLENEKQVLRNALRDEAGSLCNVLSHTISYGVAYHHSGLTSEERKIIEEGFRQGVVCVICCTSTLAAGVNLPAKRVIIRNPYVGRDFISLSRYKQMIGRAGRAGYGELGESITICSPLELPRIRDLLLSPMDIALSSMHANGGEGLQNFLLSCVSLHLANTKRDLYSLALRTLMAVQCERLQIDIKKLIKSTIKNLFKLGAIGTKDFNHDVHNTSIRLECSLPTQGSLASSVGSQKTVVTLNNDTVLEISKLGMAAMKGGLDLLRAHTLYDDLLQAQSSLVLFTGLHLMYLVTPYLIAEQVTPSKPLYYSLYIKLDVREVQTAKVLGFTDAVAAKLLTNRKITEISERVLNRFYVTLMLYDLWNEMSVYEVSAKYDVNRGLIQNLMTAAASFASNVFHFCTEFDEFWAFSLLIKGMCDRLSHCCVKELVPLMKLPSVKQNRAKQLFNAGYKTLQLIAKANPDDLIRDIEYMNRKLANQLIAASKMILLEKVENLREEAEEVLDGIDFTN